MTRRDGQQDPRRLGFSANNTDGVDHAGKQGIKRVGARPGLGAAMEDWRG
jgi:hypothetical protein